MISDELKKYVEKFVTGKDEAGMTAGLYISFDDLHLGPTSSTLMDIAVLCMIFTIIQGGDPEKLIKEKLRHLEGCAEHSLPIHGVTNLNKLLSIHDKTLVMTVKHSVNLSDEDEVELQDRNAESEFDDANEREHTFEEQVVPA